MITTRDEITKILNQDIVGCELGVFEGEFSNILLNTNKFKKLYLVDMFTGMIDSGDKNGNNVKYKNGEDLLKEVTFKFKNNKNIEVVKSDSLKFLSNFENHFFDFIYIDTSHQYEHTKNELNLSLKKIKPGGIISGHDYNKTHFKGVVDAVDEFSKENKLELHLTTSDFLETFYFKL